MDCRETREYISAIVDKELLEQKQQQDVHDHIGRCTSCRDEYELEVLTKAELQKRVKMVPMPAHVKNNMLQYVRKAETRSSIAGFFEKLRNLFFAGGGRTLALAALPPAFIVMGIFYFQSDDESTMVDAGKSHLITEAVNNYNAFDVGRVASQGKSADVSETHRLLEGRVDFDVQVPVIEGFQLLGGMVSERQDIKSVHLVYAKDDDIIYICQTKIADLRKKGLLDLPPEAKTAVRQGRLYTENRQGDRNVAIWGNNQMVYSAVANMDKSELMTLLTQGD